MKKLILCFFCCICLISCKSTVHLPIPGESTIKQNNIYSEYMSIGDAYLDLEKFDKAITYYQKAMVNKNLYWTAYYKLGRSYALSKKWKDAKKVYFDLLKRDPENISVRMSLAYITAMEGDLDSAEEIYKSLWNNNSDNSEILVNYINVLIANNNVSEAKNLIKTLKEKFQENKNIESFEKKIEELSKEVLEDFTEKSSNTEESSAEN